jgi:hypothetical protein
MCGIIFPLSCFNLSISSSSSCILLIALLSPVFGQLKRRRRRVFCVCCICIILTLFGVFFFVQFCKSFVFPFYSSRVCLCVCVFGSFVCICERACCKSQCDTKRKKKMNKITIYERKQNASAVSFSFLSRFYRRQLCIWMHNLF